MQREKQARVEDPSFKPKVTLRHVLALAIGGLAVVAACNALPMTAEAADRATAAPSAVAQCNSLRLADFSGIQDAPTQVTTAKPVDATRRCICLLRSAGLHCCPGPSWKSADFDFDRDYRQVA